MPVAHQRSTVLELIRANANSRGWVALDIMTIAERTGIPAHDVTKSLWGLQKQDLVSFRERKLGNGTNGRTKSALSRIRLTSRGRTIEERELAVLPEASLPEASLPEGEDPPAPLSVDERVANVGSLLADYPLIRTLIARREHLEQAAALLSSADADELAVAALDRIEATTPLEREILRLVAALALERG